VTYNEGLAARVRDKLGGVKAVTEREMFGGIAFMVAGNMCCGVLGDDLMVRVGSDLHQDALTRPHVREAGVTGRAVRGMVYVGREGVADDAELDLWVGLGLAHARSLPPRATAKATAKKAKPKGKTSTKGPTRRPRPSH
jgi:TfoX-like protein